MVKRIDKLTDEQRAHFDEWADRWIEIGLRTGPANRPKFEVAAKRCYEAAGLPWHGNVVWVSSPILMVIAAPVAALVIELARGKRMTRRDAVRDAVDGAVRGAVRGAVDDAVGDAVRDAVRDVIRRGWFRFIGGQFWVSGWYWGGAWTSYFRDICALELVGDLWDRALAYEATMESACWWYPHRDFVIVCERPSVIHRELVRPDVTRGWGSHRLHCATGPAVAWPDGWGVYSIHGVRVPFKKRHIVEQPELITIADIETEANAELRRVMIDRYGPARYVVDSGARVVHELAPDHRQIGLRSARLLVKRVQDDEPIVYVDLLNSTPEPDGTTKRYMLRVDPNAYGGDAMRNAHAAVASTWRNADGSMTYARWEDYCPAAES